VGSSTKDWLITSVPRHSSHHSSRADNSSRGTSNHIDIVVKVYKIIVDRVMSSPHHTLIHFMHELRRFSTA